MKQQGYNVTVYSSSSIEQIKNGKIMSSQGMFNQALMLERELGIDFWKNTAPQNHYVSFAITDPHSSCTTIQWRGMTNHAYQSVDQRIKFSSWMEEYEKMDGNLIIQEVDLPLLNQIAANNDLTIVASGKGKVSSLFRRDDEKSVFDKPQRALACIYIENVVSSDFPGVRANIISGIGEYFIIPGLSLNGPCEMMLFEGIPGGAFDCWNGLTTVDEYFAMAMQLLKNYLPLEAERCKYARPTDNNGFLSGRYTPVVKYPTSKMPCGKSVLGMGDAVVLNDPIAGQGANNAVKAADIYLRRIVHHGAKQFDEDWMLQTFQTYWNQCAMRTTQWTNLQLITQAPHVDELMTEASNNPQIANLLANSFDNPSILYPWITNADETRQRINTMKNKKYKRYQRLLSVVNHVTNVFRVDANRAKSKICG